MSQKTQPDSTTHPSIVPASETLASGQIGQRQFRIDAPHAATVGAAANTSPTPSDTTAPAPPRTVDLQGLRREAQVLMEASQLIQQCYEQLSSVDQRQQELDQREMALAQEHADRELELSARLAEFNTSELALISRIEEFEAHQRLLENRWDEVEARDAALSKERESMRLELEQEVASREARLQSEALRLQELAEQLTRQQTATQSEIEQTLRIERERLWQTLAAEWDEHRTRFTQEQQSWQIEMQAAKEAWESAQQTRMVDTLRQEQSLADRATSLAAVEEDLIRREQECQTQFRSLEKLQTELESGELTRLSEARREWEAVQAEAAAEFAQERSQLESRMRFQQEHLEKSRLELDTQQREFRAERQRELSYLVDLNQKCHQRMDQLETFRLALDEREKSLDRQEELLRRSQGSTDTSATTPLELLNAQQAAWEADRLAQQTELQRQQSLLTSQLDNLESRRHRLDRLRLELEETHRATLEIRLAVEEAWAQLAQHLGDQDARDRVELARSSLNVYYEHLHAGLKQQQFELNTASEQIELQRSQFQAERQQLTDWVTARDEQLRLRSERLHDQAAQLEAHETAWNALRERWLADKIAAERVIRQLLADITLQHQSRATEPLPIIPSEEFISTRLAAIDRQDAEPWPLPAPHFQNVQTPWGSLHD